MDGGRHAEAVEEIQLTLAFLDQVGDRVEPHIADFTRMNLRMLIGGAHARLENWAEAVEHLVVAVELCRDSGNAAMESRALVHLGDSLLAAGKGAEARDAFSRCLALGETADPGRLTEARERLDGPGTP